MLSLETSKLIIVRRAYFYFRNTQYYTVDVFHVAHIMFNVDLMIVYILF